MRRRLLLLIPVYLPQPFHVAARQGGGATPAGVNAGKWRPTFISSFQEFDFKIKVNWAFILSPKFEKKLLHDYWTKLLSRVKLLLVVTFSGVQCHHTKQLSVLQMCHTCVAAVRKTTMIWTQVSKFPENSIKLCACDCAEEGCVEITHTAVSWQKATCGVKYFNICVFLPERNKVKEGDAASISQKIYIRTIPTFQFDTPVWAALCLSLTHLSPPSPTPSPSPAVSTLPSPASRSAALVSSSLHILAR